MVTTGEIKKVLAKLDGCSFSNYEELENAVYPLFGPLQAGMPGMTFRDLADMLRRKGWAQQDKSGAFLLKFPPVLSVHERASSFDQRPPELAFQSVPVTQTVSTNLSFREIALLVQLHTHKVIRGDLGFNSLISRGLIEYVNIVQGLPDSEVSAIKGNMLAAKTQIMASILTDDFKGALIVLHDLVDAQNTVQATDMVYRLTEAGLSYMQDQADSLLET